MQAEEFSLARERLGKTQKQLARLLGVSLKAVQSYEQGWRTVPLHVERQLYFLLANQREAGRVPVKPCWEERKCAQREECPAWEFQAGHLCWFLNGTLCECAAGTSSWKDKMKVCRSCKVLASLL